MRGQCWIILSATVPVHPSEITQHGSLGLSSSLAMWGWTKLLCRSGRSRIPMGRYCSELSFLTVGMALQDWGDPAQGTAQQLFVFGEPFPLSRLPQTFARGRDILGL